MTATYAVTGVASGIGAALARILQDAGHRVVGFDIHATAANVDLFIPLDLGDPAPIDAAVARVDVPLDRLCNNARIPPRARAPPRPAGPTRSHGWLLSCYLRTATG